MRALLPFAALFDRVTQAHPDRDSRFCRNRARRSAQGASCPRRAPRFRPVAPDGQPPLAFIKLYPRHSRLRRRGERPDWVDMSGQRARLPLFAPGRDIPTGTWRDYCARPGEDASGKTSRANER